MSDWALSVHELNEYIRKRLASDPMLHGVRVKGEISGLKKYASGHYYFSLKDESARLDCVMYASQASDLLFEPKDGDTVTLSGQAGLNVKEGHYRFFTESMEQQGVGDLYLRFERLKHKLREEGLFDAACKKPLPMLPKTIGIVTSESGAAVHDMIKIIRQRDPNIGILLRPTLVQGSTAAKDIAAAIQEMNTNGKADVLLVGRGGGSMEDLWPFNEEIVARAIFDSKIPIVSCVGHEVDFTIADLVADVRAATPTHAAEIAVPSIDMLAQQIDSLCTRADKIMRSSIERQHVYLRQIGSRQVLRSPEKCIITEKMQQLEHTILPLKCPENLLINERRRALDAVFGRKASALDPSERMIPLLQQRLLAVYSKLSDGSTIMVQSERKRHVLEATAERAERTMRDRLIQYRNLLIQRKEKFEALDPTAVLMRGYAVVTGKNGIIEDADAVSDGEDLTILVRNGKIAATVKGIDCHDD